MVKVTWYGHACIGIEVGPHRLLVDPFLTGNPLAAASPDALQPDFILISHGHGDHVGDGLEIARRTGALVISNFEICNWFQAQGHTNVHPHHIGGGFHYPFGYLKLPLPITAPPSPMAPTAATPAGS
jgi:L-ascorbate metabolism protein UlaG (beta-lactamase superfamily)